MAAKAKVITPPAILSYPNLFEPNENGKFECVLVFEPGTDLTELKRAALGVAVEKFGKDRVAKMLKMGQLRLEGGPHHTFRTDGVSKGYPEGAVFIGARGNRRPGVVSVYPDPATGKPMPITDPEELYPGCKVRASVTAFWYDVDGNRGISWGLNNIQKIADGERLDGAVAAEDEFEADEAALADLAALGDDAANEDEAPAAAKTAPKTAPKAPRATDPLAELIPESGEEEGDGFDIDDLL